MIHRPSHMTYTARHMIHTSTDMIHMACHTIHTHSHMINAHKWSHLLGNDVYPAKARKQAPCCWPQRQRSKEDLLQVLNHSSGTG